VISPIPSAKISRLTDITNSIKTGSTAVIAYSNYILKATKPIRPQKIENKFRLQTTKKNEPLLPRIEPPEQYSAQ
jgi:hypothetical protein